ncbi:NAD-dependent epimerase/dehydratase family protein [Thermodesulfovibrionales bacterium]|nr:NAD-dependent epimerase/dehydratase family protein [Thermodesulfovibrionales bacterium]
MKYLVTGGCGFLGSNLAHEVLRRGEDLVIFDNLSRAGNNKNLDWLRMQGEFQYIHGDIRNREEIERTVKDSKPNTIFHLAGQVAMTTSIENPRLDFEVNAVGTFNLLEAVRKYSPETKMIYSSTNKVYGDLGWIRYEETETRYTAPDYPNGFDESIPLDFHSPYGCSKGAADQYILDYARMFGLKTVVFRHSSMYGGRQFATYDQGWIGWFCQKALEIKRGTLKEPFTISGNGKQVRDVLHAEDMKRLYFVAVEHIDQAKGQAFNIGGGIKNSLSLLELFALLEELLDIRLTYTKIPWRQSDQRVFVADISKAQRLFNWKPKLDKKEGISRMIKWLLRITNYKEASD